MRSMQYKFLSSAGQMKRSRFCKGFFSSAAVAVVKGGDGKPTVEEIRGGYAVLIQGYQLGITVLALAVGQEVWEVFPHLNPFKAWFYTTAYRWALRHFAL